MKLAAVMLMLVLAQTTLAQVERVEIVGAERAERVERAPAAAAGGVPAGPLVVSAGVLVAAGGVGWWVWRRWSRLGDAERACRLLSLQRGVRHRERARVRDDARARGVAPVAVLVARGR